MDTALLEKEQIDVLHQGSAGAGLGTPGICLYCIVQFISRLQLCMLTYIFYQAAVGTFEAVNEAADVVGLNRLELLHQHATCVPAY